MSPPDKRRGSSHTGRSSTPSRNSSIIAPPPKAQLIGPTSSSSSPGPENESAHDSNNPQPASREGSASFNAKGEHESVLMKEKDSLIAKLQHELSVMESEFVRELDRLSQNENESTNFWRTKHSTLNQQFLRTDTELRLLRAEVDLKEAERLELREGHEALMQDIRQRDEEIRSLRGHLNGMKQWVNTSTRMDSQASDEEISEDLTRLGNGLQNWVIVHFRRAKMDITKADAYVVGELQEIIPMCSEPSAPSKVHMLQSIVSAILVDMVFKAYFVGLSDQQTAQLKQTEELLVSLGLNEVINQWRANTLSLVRKEGSDKLKEEANTVVENVISRVNKIFSAITDATTTEARDQMLRTLVTSSVELAQLLGVQKAYFEVTMPKIVPSQSTIFNPSTMEDIGGEDEAALMSREICCVTFPGLTKTGDENGGQSHFRNVISKIKVLCSPE